METPNSFSSIANKVIGALPVIGLLARIMSDEGGVGDDLVDFAEFRRRVGKNCTADDSTAFYKFQDRRGKVINRFGSYPFIQVCIFVFVFCSLIIGL